MKITFTLAAAALLAAAPAFAGERLSANGGGHISGQAHSFAASGGVSFGNGKSSSEAGQFSGSMGQISGGLTDARDGLRITVTNESFTEGFDKSSVRGDAFAGGIRGGFAEGHGSYWGGAFGEWN